MKFTVAVLAMMVLTAGAWADGEKVDLPGIKVRGEAEKYIEAEGAAALTNGILEFVACEPGTRDYESLLTLKCKPSALQFALLLIGCNPGPNPEEAKEGQKAGDRLDLEVEWTANGKTQRLPVERFLINRKTGQVPKDLPWYYTGSKFVKGIEGKEVFLADSEQAHISLWWYPGLLINVGGKFGNPYNGPEEGFEVNPRVVLPAGTPIKLILRKHAGR